MQPEAIKPLGGKTYGSIPHLPGSKFGNRDDKGLDDKQAAYFIDDNIKSQKIRRTDKILVLEKLDGSCVSIANINGIITPLIRSGYHAKTSNYLQHKLFDAWVMANIERFYWIPDGWRLCGEWLIQAHGTHYNLDGREPFVAFDLFNQNERKPYQELVNSCCRFQISTARVLCKADGRGIPVRRALGFLGEHGYYGAIDQAEGCVWRWERGPAMEIMMAKYVRPTAEPGRYLQDENNGGKPEFNIDVNEMFRYYFR